MPIDPRDLARLNELLDALDEAEGRNDWTPTFLRFGIPAAAGVAGGLASLLSSGLALGPSIALGAGSAGLGEQLAQEYEHAYYGRERNPLQTAVQTGVGGFPLGRVGSLGSALAKNAALGATGTALTYAAEGQTPGVGDVAAGAALGGGVGGAFHLGFDALARLLGGRRLAALRTAAEPQGERYADLGQGPVETPKLTEAEATRAALEAARARAATELDVLRSGRPTPYLDDIAAEEARAYTQLGREEPPVLPHGPVAETSSDVVPPRSPFTHGLGTPFGERDWATLADINNQLSFDRYEAVKARERSVAQSGRGSFLEYDARTRELHDALDAAEAPFRATLHQFEDEAERAALQTPERQLTGGSDDVFDLNLGRADWNQPPRNVIEAAIASRKGPAPLARFFQGEAGITDVTQPGLERQPFMPERSFALQPATETPTPLLGEEQLPPVNGWINIQEPPGTLKPGEVPLPRSLDPVLTAEQGLPPMRGRENVPASPDVPVGYQEAAPDNTGLGFPGYTKEHSAADGYLRQYVDALGRPPIRESWGVIEPDSVAPPTLPAGPDVPAELPPSELAGLLNAGPPAQPPPKVPRTRINFLDPRVRQDRFRPIGDLDQQIPPRVPPLPPEPSPPKPRRRGPRGQQGYINPQALYPLGGALTGGAVGAPIGAATDEENPWRGALIGGGLGALLGAGAGLGATHIRTPRPQATVEQPRVNGGVEDLLRIREQVEAPDKPNPLFPGSRMFLDNWDEAVDLPGLINTRDAALRWDEPIPEGYRPIVKHLSDQEWEWVPPEAPIASISDLFDVRAFNEGYDVGLINSQNELVFSTAELRTSPVLRRLVESNRKAPPPPPPEIPEPPLMPDEPIPYGYRVEFRDNNGWAERGPFRTMGEAFDQWDNEEAFAARLIAPDGSIAWSTEGPSSSPIELTQTPPIGPADYLPTWDVEVWDNHLQRYMPNMTDILDEARANAIARDLRDNGGYDVRIVGKNQSPPNEPRMGEGFRGWVGHPQDFDMLSKLPDEAPMPDGYRAQVLAGNVWVNIPDTNFNLFIRNPWASPARVQGPGGHDIWRNALATKLEANLTGAPDLDMDALIRPDEMGTVARGGLSEDELKRRVEQGLRQKELDRAGPELDPTTPQGGSTVSGGPDQPYTFNTYSDRTGEWTRADVEFPNRRDADVAARNVQTASGNFTHTRPIRPTDAPPPQEQIPTNDTPVGRQTQYYIEWKGAGRGDWGRLDRVYDSHAEAAEVANDLIARGYTARIRGEKPELHFPEPTRQRFGETDFAQAMDDTPRNLPTRDLTPEEAAELRQLLDGAIEEGRKGTQPDPESLSWWDELLRGFGDNPPDPNDPNRGQGGFANPQALYPLAGGFAGGAIGAPLGAAADEDSPARGALSGGLLGAMLGAGLGARGAARGGGKGSPSRPSTVAAGKPGTTPVPAPPSPEQPPKGKGIRRLWEATTQSRVPGRKPIPTDRRKQIGMDRLRHSPQLSEEIERDIDRMFEEHNAYAAARGGRQPDARTMALAQRIKVDMDKRQPERHRLNDEQTVAYASAMMTAAEKAEPLKKKMLAGQATDTDIIEFTRLLNQLGLVDATLSGSASEAGRVLRRQRYLTNVQPGDIVAAGAAARRALTNPKMQAALKLPFDDPDALGKLITASRAHGFLRMGLGYYVNNILSGILTQERNLGGNTASLLNRALVKPMAVAGDVAVSAATGRPRQLYMGEVREELTGALSALHKAWQDAYYTMRYGHSVERIREMTETLGTKGSSADSVFEMEHVELPGGGMNPINWPSRMLDAGDRFFYQLNKGAEIHAQAYGRAMQNARKAGKTGDAAWVAQEAAKIRLDPPAEMVAAVREQARRGVYREQVPPAIAHLLAMKEHLPVLNLVIPFVRMPYNLMKQGIEHSPLGLLAKQGTSQRLMTSLVKGAAEGEERATAMGLGRVLEGTAALVPLAMYAAAGKISGAGPSDQNKKAALMRTGWRPNSFNVPLPEGVAKTLGASRSDDGTYWVPYQLFQPISQPLMLLANGFELWQEGQTFQDPAKLEKWAQTVGLRFANSSISQSFLSGLANFVGALEDPDRWAKQFVGGTATGFVPLSGALTTVQRATDKTIRETDTPLDVVWSRMPGLSKQLPPKLDVYGRDLRREESAWNALTPIGRKEDAVDAELRRLGITLAPPSDRLEFRLPRGRVARLTQQEEQETLARARGMSDRAALVRLMNSSAYRHAEDYEKQILVRRAMSRAGQQVTNRARAALRGGRAQDLERLLTPQQRDLASQ